MPRAKKISSTGPVVGPCRSCEAGNEDGRPLDPMVEVEFPFTCSFRLYVCDQWLHRLRTDTTSLDTLCDDIRKSLQVCSRGG